MATFTPEEIEIMKSRGNQYCKSVWLGLYDSEIPTSDEQQIKDFMIAKYEKKRYYIDPSFSTTHCAINFPNGSRTPSSLSSTSSSSHNSPSSQNLSDSSLKLQNSLRSQSSKTNSVISSTNSSQLFTVNFESPLSTSSSSSVDPFGSAGMDSSSCSETSFANFDNNPAFNSNGTIVRTTPGNGIRNNYNHSNTYAGFGLTWGFPSSSFHKPTLKSLPLAFSRWSIATESISNFGKNKNESNVPTEDKYAALKDLDSQMKNQMLEKQQEELKQKHGSAVEWGASSNGVNWNQLFSNNQGFSSEPSTPFNPFSGDICALKPTANGSANPFGSNTKDPWNSNVNWPNPKNQLQSTTSNGWNSEIANPFDHQKGGWTQSNGQHQSSNPFL